MAIINKFIEPWITFFVHISMNVTLQQMVPRPGIVTYLHHHQHTATQIQDVIAVSFDVVGDTEQPFK